MSDKIPPYVFDLDKWRREARELVSKGTAAMFRVTQTEGEEKEKALAEMKASAEQLRGSIGFKPVTDILKALDQADYWKGLKNLIGFVQDGSNTTVKIFWDDATTTAYIQVGKKSYTGTSLDEVLRNAIDAQGAAPL